MNMLPAYHGGLSREISHLVESSLLQDRFVFFYSVDYPGLHFPVASTVGLSIMSVFMKLPPKGGENPTYCVESFSKAWEERMWQLFFQGKVCMSQILFSVTREFWSGFLLNPS